MVVSYFEGRDLLINAKEGFTISHGLFARRGVFDEIEVPEEGRNSRCIRR